MAHGARELGDFPEAMVRLYCAECHRFAQYGRERLVERFGRDQSLPSLLDKLTPCPRVKDQRRPCQVTYFDLLPAEARQRAIDRGGLPAGWKAG
jgi:hypothetical protein